MIAISSIFAAFVGLQGIDIRPKQPGVGLVGDAYNFGARPQYIEVLPLADPRKVAGPYNPWELSATVTTKMHEVKTSEVAPMPRLVFEPLTKSEVAKECTHRIPDELMGVLIILFVVIVLFETVPYLFLKPIRPSQRGT